MRLLKITGGKVWDSSGKLVQQRMWWPIRFGMFFYVMFHRTTPLSTGIIVRKSGNEKSHQPISLLLVNHPNEAELFWGSDLTIVAARTVAGELNKLCDYFESFNTRGE